ncbi:hypothetical protein M408DRAFT_331094 [Serendipita vermifera MAFF 305830]|uniref:Uncharacterized protein n=1 Tax=Serendipita vermifera MAFF 305830 TaxID=933852 RepID=A0A0C3B1X3_SERVB|nr:hypothetical protein M408DRAFT_331094 [Serendipita vermifera MAFF 305830]
MRLAAQVKIATIVDTTSSIERLLTCLALKFRPRSRCSDVACVRGTGAQMASTAGTVVRVLGMDFLAVSTPLSKRFVL